MIITPSARAAAAAATFTKSGTSLQGLADITRHVIDTHFETAFLG
jgi:hypothetical protein